VLGEIGVAGVPQLRVYNKIDLVDAGERERLARRAPAAVEVSAVTGDGLTALLERIAAEASKHSTPMRVLIPFDRGDLVRVAHDEAELVREEATPEGWLIDVRVPQQLANRFAPFEQREDGPGER
jgi:GTP-binding protein HflX